MKELSIEEKAKAYDEAIAWLEKQGGPTEINPSEFESRLNKLLKQFESLPKEELASSLSFYLNVVQNDGTYKQGEHKEPCKTCDYPMLNCQNFPCDKKKCEQKQSDDTKTKFDIGDWIRFISYG